MAALAVATVLGRPSNRATARFCILSVWDYVYVAWKDVGT